MANLDDLRNRIIREVNREELTDAPNADDRTAANSATLDDCIRQAIDYYSDNRFAFNEARVVVEADGEYLDLPANLRLLDAVVREDGSRYTLRKQDYLTLEVWQQGGTPPDPTIDIEPFDFAAYYNSLPEE